MGYRSDIYIKVSIGKEKELWELMEKHNMTGDDGFKKVKEDDSHYYLKCSHLKWYDSYSDVDAINGFIDDNHETCGLIGIGEDGLNSATAGSPDELDMYMVSEIDW